MLAYAAYKGYKNRGQPSDGPGTMDKVKGIAKGGWHPAGDREIHRPHRDTWKEDIKGFGKKKDPFEAGRNHESAPLSTLKDPDSFGPPPKRTTDGLGTGGSPTTAVASSSRASGPSGGLGAPVVQSGYARQKQEREEQERQRYAEEVEEQKSQPYRMDTSGLRTDNLPKPPVRRADGANASPVLPPRAPPRQNASPAPPPPPRNAQNASPLPPPRHAQAPPPVLPPRQTEYPDEHTPAPPPTYGEALHHPRADPAAVNQGAANRLAQAGVSVPGFGIGGNDTESEARGPPAAQLTELQQHFARAKIHAGARPSEPASPATSASPSSPLAAAAHKKAPPPPPPKKAALHAPSTSAAESANTPPPLPMSSKPRPS